MFAKILHFITRILSSITWNGIRALFNGGIYYKLTEEDHDKLRQLLAEGNFIILTYHATHLTSYLIAMLSFLKTRKSTEYVHALMNVDNIDDPNEWLHFKLMEATNAGVHYSSFLQTFDCDRVCILKPKGVTIEEWCKITEALLEQDGKQYDDLFDLSDNSKVSCVELCLVALRKDPHYNNEFKNFENMIKNFGNLTPQMFRDCDDFEVVLEIKR
jgi:hypothetical protein